MGEQVSNLVDTLALRASRTENLGVLPQLAARIVHLTQSPNASAREMETLVSRDVALAAKVLKVANSSYYGGQRVSSISRAVTSLGMVQVRQLVVSVAYHQMTNHRPSAASFDPVRFWGHSLAVAILARAIATQVGRAEFAEELYVAGLMHDVGILILDRLAPDLLETALSLAHRENQPLHVIEEEKFGFHHGHLGGAVVRQWGFSPALARAIEYQFDWEEDADGFSPILAVANSIAHGNGLLNQTAAVDTSMEALEKIQLSPEKLQLCVTELVQQMVEAEGALGIQAAA